MSSDSEDEDELLQMALKDQSQRDLNYGKPSSTSNSRKPVANYVQPPSSLPEKPASVANSTGAKHKGGAGARRVVDDDDDSEVEMLSISSGDEDDAKDRVARSKGRGATAGKAGRGTRDDDRGWDGDEPNCWKFVDETELARRVREMRETRTAPVAQKFEKKASGMGRNMLNNLQSFPRGMECVDPLGLGTLRLITEASDRDPDKDLVDGKLREKLMFYQDTSAADLEAGALDLKTDFKTRNQQRKQLVKDNFDCFVSCKTTIDDIESKLKWI